MADAAPLVRHAQERPDGQGYPAGNGAGSIALGARIIAAADAFDVMIRLRVFRDAVSRSAALSELERCSGCSSTRRWSRPLSPSSTAIDFPGEMLNVEC